MATENIVTGRKYRILSDAVNQIWDKISFWSKASDTEANDGNTLEYKVGAINGITDALDSEDSSIAASSVAVKTLNDSLQWKLVQAVTGSTAITLPASFSELLVIVGHNVSKNYAFNVPFVYLTDDAKTFTGGSSLKLESITYLNQVEFECSKTTCTLTKSRTSQNDTLKDYLKNSTMTVYYR